MSQFFTDFSDYEMNAPPHDWVDAWVPGDHSLVVAPANDAKNGVVLRHNVTSHERRAWAWTTPGGSSEVEVLARLRSDDPRARFGVMCRGGYQDDRESIEGITWELFNGEDRDEGDFEETRQEYRQIAWLATYAPAMAVHKGPKRPHGIGSIRGEGYFPWEPGLWYWMRLQAGDDDGYIAVRAKVWAGSSEPDGWTYDIQRTESADVGRQGWVGITGQRTEGSREYDFFSVGTDGDPAPAP